MGIPMSPTCSECNAELWTWAARPFACRTCYDRQRGTLKDSPTLCLGCLVAHQRRAHGTVSADLIQFLRGVATSMDGYAALRAREILRALDVPVVLGASS